MKRRDSSSRACQGHGAVHCDAMTTRYERDDPDARQRLRYRPRILHSLPWGRKEDSKASLFNVLQAGGWAAVYAVCTLAAEQKQGLLAGAVRYVNLGHLRVSCHAGPSSPLSAIAREVTRGVRRGAGRQRLSRHCGLTAGAHCLTRRTAHTATRRVAATDICQ